MTHLYKGDGNIPRLSQSMYHLKQFKSTNDTRCQLKKEFGDDQKTEHIWNLKL